MRYLALLCVAAHLYATSAQSQTEPDAGVDAPPEEVLVTGEFPGPGMWKVTRADDAERHVLWILGLPPPLPKKMQWKSTEVERVIKNSQEVLFGGAVNVQPDERIGFFKGISLVPAALSARKNPDKQQLRERVPDDLYQRWLVMKKRYLGSSKGVEKWRPIFAANELRSEAFDDLKLRDGSIVTDAVLKLAKTHGVKTTTPALEFKFKSKDIRAKIKEFSREPLADTECFAATLALVETISDRDMMEARAAAWASGDLQGLLEFEPIPNAIVPCIAAIMASQVAQDLMPSDMFGQLKALWLDAAERSLATNHSTFSVLSLAELTSADGQLAALRAKGYVVEEPQRE
jgi:TraB/PrgY/gumN family